ncbi:ribokinase [Microlunatus soli]|uniref:Ribokinase n=1 Tax=Microlunatus soli TaxID=630515 RepID=A0A1H2ACY0_9ACTN|nr:ribokinase [Microlunatus soli]SDT43830.1 ribokinase [Microlunatus soli]
MTGTTDRAEIADQEGNVTEAPATTAAPERHDVIVVGSANQDYVITCDALPTAGETRLASGMQKFPGGKGANQAVAAARLGAPVTFVGAVGDDDDGALVIRELRAEGVDTSEIEINSSERTGLAIVSVLPDGENAITVVPGANYTVSAERTARTVSRLTGPQSILVVQAEIPVDAIAAAVDAAVRAGARSVINLAPYTELPDRVLAAADPLVVNEIEAAALTGYAIDSTDTALRAASELAARSRSCVITLGADGACWAIADAAGRVAAPPAAQVVDSTGAGDAFIGGLVRRLTEGDVDLADAVRVGVEVGTVAVTRVGAQASYPLETEIKQLHRHASDAARS